VYGVSECDSEALKTEITTPRRAEPGVKKGLGNSHVADHNIIVYKHEVLYNTTKCTMLFIYFTVNLVVLYVRIS
jgi:hypothetical protein